MHYYQAYELSISSELELPGLPEAPASSSIDVEILQRPLARPELLCSPDGKRIGAFFHDLARFLIEDGRRIMVDIVGDVEEDVIAARVLGEIFATLLRQRGLLVLHACAVEKEGEAIAFVGESGWGKSTLAEAFCQRGYSLVTDDVLALSFEGSQPTLVSSYPEIRLRTDSAEFLVPDGSGLSPIERNGPKLARSGMALSQPGTPLASLYVLEPRFRSTTSVVDLAPSDALIDLVKHTRARTLIQTNVPPLLAAHLHQCGALVRAVQPALLRRRGSFEALPETVEAVEADRAGAPRVLA